MQNGAEVALTDRRRALIFVNLVVSGIAASILSTAMTTALPNVVASFGVSTAVGQWVTSGYSLAMSMVMPLTAFLITRFPTKLLHIGGNVSSYGLRVRAPVPASACRDVGKRRQMHSRAGEKRRRCVPGACTCGGGECS